MLLEGGSTKIAAAGVGVTSLAVGLVEASAGQGSLLGPLNIVAGGSLLIVLWVGQRIVRVAERFFEDQGEKLIALPTADKIEADKRTLFEKLEAFAHEASEERKETSIFRRELAGILADHGARIKTVEESVHLMAAERRP